MSQEKICSKCGDAKPATIEFFHNKGIGSDLLDSCCKQCKNKRVSEYRAKNKKKVAEAARLRYIANKESISKRRKAFYIANRDSFSLKHKLYYSENKSQISERVKVKMLLPQKYSTAVSNKLFADKTQKGHDGNLLVNCKNSACNKTFTPHKRSVQARIEAINNPASPGTENHFYCSDKCKQSCILFKSTAATLINIDKMNNGSNLNHSSFYSQPELSVWANQVKANSKNTCEICGAIADLKAHHVEPKSIAPEKALDPANGVCLCSSCHIIHGHSDNDCRTSNLRKCEVNKQP